MIKWFRNRPRVAVVFMALAFVTLVNASALSAGECTVLDRFGLERDCTFLERYGKCNADALDSFIQCSQRYEGDSRLGQAWQDTKCQLALGIDQAACLIESPMGQILH